MLKRKQTRHENNGYRGKIDTLYLAPVLLTFGVDFFLLLISCLRQEKRRKKYLFELRDEDDISDKSLIMCPGYNCQVDN